MKRFLRSLGLGIALLGGLSPLYVQAAPSLATRLSGRILLQIQSRGEAWYVDPITKQRAYLGTAQDAFTLLRSKGLGIHHAEMIRYLNARAFPLRLSGRILIDVEDRGQAYYISPVTLQAVRLGNASETYQALRTQGLGITNANLALIQPTVTTPVTLTITLPPSSTITVVNTPSSSQLGANVPTDQLERQTFDAINQHRVSLGESALIWNERVASIARLHSENMANDLVAFGHDNFDERFQEITNRLPLSRMAENVAYNTFDNPVATAVDGWLHSEGHRINIENTVYTQTGIGVVKNTRNEYYFTQIFIKPQNGT